MLLNPQKYIAQASSVRFEMQNLSKISCINSGNSVIIIQTSTAADYIEFKSEMSVWKNLQDSRRNAMHERKGFTLIELWVVIGLMRFDLVIGVRYFDY